MKGATIERGGAVKERARFYLLYTLVFACLAALVFRFFWQNKKSLVWSGDGLYQHYNAFVYIGDYLREVFKTLVREHRLVFPMWEFGLGYGADVPMTLSYYGFGDPLNLLSALAPHEGAQTMYGALMIFRFYLAGVAFCAYCRKMACERFASLCAALAYVFCTYAVFEGVRQPFFLTPMIYFPLLLSGVEKLLRKEGPALFTVSVFLSAITNFYFFYMLALLTVPYVLARRLSMGDRPGLRAVAGCCLRVGGCALVGVAMAAALLLPSAAAVLSDTRAAADYVFPALYGIDAYLSLFVSFISNNGAIACTGVTPLAALAAGTLFLRRNKDTWLKALLVLMVVFLLFPVFGYILNGFGYVSGRWVWAYVFFFTFAFARELPRLFSLETCENKKEKLLLTLFCTAYTGICLSLSSVCDESVVAGCLLLFGSLAFIWCGGCLRDVKLKKIVLPRRRLVQLTALLLTAAGVLMMSDYRYDPEKGKYLQMFWDAGEPLRRLTGQRALAWELIDDGGFYRVDSCTELNSQENYAVSSGQSTTTVYWSLTNPYVAEYMKLNSAYYGNSYNIKGLQSRTLLLPFACAPYYVCIEGQEALVPYGYALAGNVQGYCLYETENSLPLGYTCARWISSEDYAAMTQPQRQQAMLQGAVVQAQDEAAVAALEKADARFTDTALEYGFFPDGAIELGENSLTVKGQNASGTFNFDCPANCELYICFTGLRFSGEGEDVTSTVLTAACGQATASAEHYTQRSIVTHGRTDFVFNLAYSEQARTQATLTFSKPGTYTYDSMTVVCQPTEGLETYVGALREDVLQDVKIETDSISGSISLAQEKLLCLSVPYAAGWRLWVDGEETPLLRVNVMYMGVPLSAGAHTIELRYCTPHIKTGLLLSGLGAAALALVCVLHKKRKDGAGA